ncbi:MAG: hypothetical protein PHW87_11780 [Methanothrix sp.]|nr:hypothetical protein [Methanothrix sp.]
MNKIIHKIRKERDDFKSLSQALKLKRNREHLSIHSPLSYHIFTRIDEPGITSVPFSSRSNS